jgi:hypothetical protein
MCDKEAYENKDAATFAARGLSKRMKTALHAYTCNDCGKVHLTSIKKKKLLRKKKLDKYPIRVEDFNKKN